MGERHPKYLDASVFRDANQRIISAFDQTRAAIDRVTVLCECPRVTCDDMIDLARSDYDAARAHPDWFVVAWGHNESDRAPVREADGYWTVDLGPG